LNQPTKLLGCLSWCFTIKSDLKVRTPAPT